MRLFISPQCGAAAHVAEDSEVGLNDRGPISAEQSSTLHARTLLHEALGVGRVRIPAGLGRTHQCWQAMIQRCLNPRATSFERYGGRGIRVCDEWLGTPGFFRFVEDMGTRPSLQHTIDRERIEAGYEPGNCRWATKSEQAANRSRTRLVVLDGEAISIEECARRHGVSDGSLRKHLANGLTIDEAVSLASSRRIGPKGLR